MSMTIGQPYCRETRPHRQDQFMRMRSCACTSKPKGDAALVTIEKQPGVPQIHECGLVRRRSRSEVWKDAQHPSNDTVQLRRRVAAQFKVSQQSHRASVSGHAPARHHGTPEAEPNGSRIAQRPKPRDGVFDDGEHLRPPAARICRLADPMPRQRCAASQSLSQRATAIETFARRRTCSDHSSLTDTVQDHLDHNVLVVFDSQLT